MKFLADECCDTGLVALLRKDGHDVLYQLEEGAGSEDSVVLERAYREGRILLTEDKDFGELVYRLGKRAIGVVLLRIGVRERHLKWPRLKKLIETQGDRLRGRDIVVDRNKFRIRPMVYKL